MSGIALNYVAIHGPQFFGNNISVTYKDGAINCINQATNERVSFVNEVIMPPIKNFAVSSTLLTIGSLMLYNGALGIYNEMIDSYAKMEADSWY